MSEFRMPSLGADMDAGTLVEWLKRPGDHVKRGDIIAVVETQKGAIEIEVFQVGVIETLLAQSGDKLPVGAVMAIIRGEGEIIPSTPSAVAIPRPPPASAVPAPQPVPSVEALAGGAIRASPAARKRAAELDLDLGKIAGSGPGGAIALADIARAAAAPASSRPVPSASVRTMRDAIAAAMARSKREIPHYYLYSMIDLEPALRWLEAENVKRPVPERLLYGVILLKATARALRDFPEFNGFYLDGVFRPSSDIHLGVAISIRQGGLIAPAIHQADRQTIGELMASFRDLVRRVRAGGLRSSELSDSTVTVTSLGEQGVEAVFPVIYPPQVAIVGFGTVVNRPWVVDADVVPRRVITASLGADHRVSDGHRGGRFLATLGRLLQEPDKL